MLISESEREKTEKQEMEAVKEMKRMMFKRYSNTAGWIDKVCDVCRREDRKALNSGKTGVVSERVVRIAVLWKQYRIMGEVVELLKDADMHAKDIRESSLLGEDPYMFGKDTYSAQLGHCGGILQMLEAEILGEVDSLFRLIDDLAADLAAEEGGK